MFIFSQIFDAMIPQAIAADAAPQQASGSSFMVMTVLLLFMMYFMIWRPQSKRAKEQRDLLSNLAVGDEVVTVGGVLGTINKITDGYIKLALANEIEVTIQKSAVSALLPKGTLQTL